jgi:hypothetical protein
LIGRRKSDLHTCQRREILHQQDAMLISSIDLCVDAAGICAINLMLSTEVLLLDAFHRSLEFVPLNWSNMTHDDH